MLVCSTSSTANVVQNDAAIFLPLSTSPPPQKKLMEDFEWIDAVAATEEVQHALVTPKDLEDTAAVGVNASPDSKGEPKPSSDSDANRNSEPDRQGEATCSSDSDANRNSEPDRQGEATCSSDSDADRSSAPNRDADSNAAPDSDANAPPDREGEANPSPDSDTDTNAAPDSDADASVALDSGGKAKPKLDSTGTSRCSPEREPSVLTRLKRTCTPVQKIKQDMERSFGVDSAAQTQIPGLSVQRRRLKDCVSLCPYSPPRDDCVLEMPTYVLRLIRRDRPSTPCTPDSVQDVQKDVPRASPPHTPDLRSSAEDRCTWYVYQVVGWIKATFRFCTSRCAP